MKRERERSIRDDVITVCNQRKKDLENICEFV